MSYGKHQCYLNSYTVHEGGTVELPDSCNWVVMKYVGSAEGFGQFTDFTDVNDQGKICLILKEARSEGDEFWPVMSFLTKDEARDLDNELKKAIKVKKKSEGRIFGTRIAYTISVLKRRKVEELKNERK